MTTPSKEYCEICKTKTPRCEYYPAGRSRPHGKCLACDSKDSRNPRPYESKDSRYAGNAIGTISWLRNPGREVRPGTGRGRQ
jgi:hypothetical protein